MSGDALRRVEFPGAGVRGCGGPCKHHSQKGDNAGEVRGKLVSAGLSQMVLGQTAGV